MRTNSIIGLIIFVVLLFLLIVLKSSNTSKPNLLIIFPDQMRAQAMGFINQDPVITPNLDRFAKESIVFTQAVSNYPLCSPFRAMFLTGKYPFNNGVNQNCYDKTAKSNVELKTDETCWSDILKENNYDLGYIGKWHLDAPQEPYLDCKNNVGENKWNEWCPPERRHGFDFWYAYGTYDYHTKPLYWKIDAKRDDFHFVDEWGPIHEADMAIKYLENNDGTFRDNDKPFALVVAMNPPHDDGEGYFEEVPQKYVDMYGDLTYKELSNRKNVVAEGGENSKLFREGIKGYFAMVTGVDDQFGRILETLERNDLDKNTIVLFLSDHGELLGSHDLRGKSYWYEESMRIPLIIRYPEKIKPRHDDLLISVPDIFPTFLSILGLQHQIPNDVMGTDFSDYLYTGKGNKPSSQIYMFVDDIYKPKLGKRGARTKEFTFAITKNEDEEKKYLFDNINDPFQLNNIADSNSVLVDDMLVELKSWQIKLNDPWIKGKATN